jgi:hypothetical protein
LGSAAGVVSYDVDLNARTCRYYGVDHTADVHVEHYPHVILDDMHSPTIPAEPPGAACERV